MVGENRVTPEKFRSDEFAMGTAVLAACLAGASGSCPRDTPAFGVERR